MATQVQTRFDVGGVMLDRPFKIRRLGHFGYNAVDMDGALHFYTDLLGFRLSDSLDFGSRAPSPDALAGLGDPNGYFMRYGGDHHAFVLFPKRVIEEGLGRRVPPGVTINQITWQVGSLDEVGNSIKWFTENGVEISRSGRDMPGSNWHTYLPDPEGHTNELYYGMEQIGWNGHSKPLPMHNRRFTEPPELPQISELDEVQRALANGVDIQSGYRYVEQLPATYDVGGVMLPRPFKIVRLGPVNLFMQDLAGAESFYRETLGFIPTEETTIDGQRCVFMRANTEHHSLGLYPIALRERLGFSPHTTCMSLGLQLANYRQLRDAIRFLREHGVRVVDTLPVDLHPGMEYTAYAFDPDGHAVQLYCAMEQIGWDARPRPRELRRAIDPNNWPEILEPMSDTYMGEPFLGPWG
jgi:catechol 2,3-dioxygenase-like lactoylglutathione lyase family enzyme